MTQHRLTCVALLGVILVSAPAHAAPPAGSDLRYKEWFESLRQPGTGIQCCSISDCRMTEYRVAANGYEVPIGGNWVPVPADKVLDRIPNPTGRGVVCYTSPTNILCFVRATEG